MPEEITAEDAHADKTDALTTHFSNLRQRFAERKAGKTGRNRQAFTDDADTKLFSDDLKLRPFTFHEDSISETTNVWNQILANMKPDDMALALFMENDFLRWSIDVPNHAALKEADPSVKPIVRLQFGCAVDEATNLPYRWCKIVGSSNQHEKTSAVVDYLNNNIIDKSLRITVGSTDPDALGSYNEEFQGTLEEYSRDILRKISA